MTKAEIRERLMELKNAAGALELADENSAAAGDIEAEIANIIDEISSLGTDVRNDIVEGARKTEQEFQFPDDAGGPPYASSDLAD